MNAGKGMWRYGQMGGRMGELCDLLAHKLCVPSAVSSWVFGRLSAQQKTLDWQVEALG